MTVEIEFEQRSRSAPFVVFNKIYVKLIELIELITVHRKKNYGHFQFQRVFAKAASR